MTALEDISAPSFWRWVIGVHFFGRPIGWTDARYLAWLAQEATSRDRLRRGTMPSDA